MKQLVRKDLVRILFERIVNTNYESLINLRERLSLDGSGETFEEDYLLLDIVLDTFELLLAYSTDTNGVVIGGKDIKYHFDNMAEFYFKDGELESIAQELDYNITQKLYGFLENANKENKEE